MIDWMHAWKAVYYDRVLFHYSDSKLLGKESQITVSSNSIYVKLALELRTQH